MTKNKIMYKEELTEEGIVKESKDGIATIVISDSESCKECTAKLYCKPGNSNERSLIVKDPFGTHPGDKVTISIMGSKILSASFLLYGIPLLLLLAGVFIGIEMFEKNREIYSSLFGLGLVLLYSVFMFFFSRKEKLNSYPEIIFVSHSQS